jgi:hypothetical protein
MPLSFGIRQRVWEARNAKYMLKTLPYTSTEVMPQKPKEVALLLIGF